MIHLPFHQPGRFWRGNLHTHSTLSDGDCSPAEVCQRYREAGYDFLALTDHFLQQYGFPLADTRPWRTPTFTTLIGAELHTGRTEFGELWHLLAVGLPFTFAPPRPDETAAELTQRALAAGAYVAVAHPHWYVLTQEDIASLGAVHAVEVFNGTAVDHNDRPDSWQSADILLGRGQHTFVCATDDFHGSPERADFCRGWVWVKCEALTPECLLAALQAGHYYSSTGPQIHDIQIEPGRRIVVRCSPASRIFVTGQASAARSAYGNGLVEAELSLHNFTSPYCRVTVRDPHGGRAWSNPIWFDA